MKGKNAPFPATNPLGKAHPQLPEGQNGKDTSSEDGPSEVNGGAATSASPDFKGCNPQGKNLVLTPTISRTIRPVSKPQACNMKRACNSQDIRDYI
jgi:hypothetical protein